MLVIFKEKVFKLIQMVINISDSLVKVYMRDTENVHYKIKLNLKVFINMF